MPSHHLTRRQFLASTSAAAAASWIAPRFAIARSGTSANSKINLACIGVGGRGALNLQAFANENVVALCDVDDHNAAASFQAHPRAKRFRDFRRLLDALGGQIDAVVVSTPDHTHFAATMAAMELGKHVFCEKPLAHTVWEARTLRKAARHYKIVSQMGNQGHATDGIRCVKEWVDAGVLGQVTEVSAWLGGINFNGRFFRKPPAIPPPAAPVPAHLDWDLWLGPCTRAVPYHPVYHPRSWRGFYEFGSGLLGDWSCHTLDAPFWALDLGMPSVVERESATGGSTEFTPDTAVARFEFPARGAKPPVVLHWHEGLPRPALREAWGLQELGDAGMIMTGDKACLMTGERPDSPRAARQPALAAKRQVARLPPEPAAQDPPPHQGRPLQGMDRRHPRRRPAAGIRLRLRRLPHRSRLARRARPARRRPHRIRCRRDANHQPPG
ncbi:MAG: Gfo/Idh/MocA family oxidoreductase, partial [Akkermansiaceae bacterium]|nr:Gfo/Idh/MocA family oxidoreductase [Akkermansiaceae bacterium]